MSSRRVRLGLRLSLLTILGFALVSLLVPFFATDFDVLRDVTSELGATDSSTAWTNPVWIVLSVILAVGVSLVRPIPLSWALLAGLAFAASYAGSALFPCASAECDEASDLQTLHGLMTVFDVLVGLCFAGAVLLPLVTRRRPDPLGLILFGVYAGAWVVGGINFLVNDWFGLFQRIAEWAFLVWLARACIAATADDPVPTRQRT